MKINKTLVMIFALALLLRLYYIFSGTLLFGFDQARDAFIVQEILSGDLKILGPSTSGVSGFFHGVLYYYFILPGYFLGQGSPFVAASWLAIWNSFTVFLVFAITRLLTGKNTPAILASIFFAFSFESVQYATWLSNPAMGVWFVATTYLGLILWLKKGHKYGSILTGLGLGFSVQSNISLMYHVLPVLYLLIRYSKKFELRKYFYFGVGLLASLSTMILAEIKFGFRVLRGFMQISQIGSSGQSIRFGDYFLIYLNKMGDLFSYNIFPLVPAFGGLVGFLILLIFIFRKWKKKELFTRDMLTVWVLSYLPAAAFGGLNVPHITVGIGVGFIIITSILIYKLLQKNKLLGIGLFILLIVVNLLKIETNKTRGQSIFAVQPGMLLRDQLELVDYTYQNSEGQFSISSITSPLFINTTWSYLYNWYGMDKYGYLPSWVGRDQVGVWGDNLSDKVTADHYYIKEDPFGIPLQYREWGEGEEDSKYDLVEEKAFGALQVQKRVAKQ